MVRGVGTAGLETISFSWLTGATTAIGHDRLHDLAALYPPAMPVFDLDAAFRGIMNAFSEMARSIRIMALDLPRILHVPAGERPSTED
jgi:hypothetical protein